MNLLSIALMRTDIVLELPNAPELLAERLHSNSLSLGLDDDHWRQELRRRFDVTLATAQALVVEMVRGRQGDSMGQYRRWPQPDTIREACSSVKFQTVGWRNINFVELILFSAFLVMLWISTIKYEDRILLVWFFTSLAGPRACRTYQVSRGVIKASSTAIMDFMRALLHRKLRATHCQSNAEELAQVGNTIRTTTT